jgi:hypothetical protein
MKQKYVWEINNVLVKQEISRPLRNLHTHLIFRKNPMKSQVIISSRVLLTYTTVFGLVIGIIVVTLCTITRNHNKL